MSNVKKFLDQIGTEYLWEKITTELNKKVNINDIPVQDVQIDNISILDTNRIANITFQVKNDIEENWNKAINFIPKKGEIIVYNAESGENIDDKAHLVPRLKIGDGITNVINLPFVVTDTISEETLENFIPKKLGHSLIFGAGQKYVFDGSKDVTVPTYTGDYNTI